MRLGVNGRFLAARATGVQRVARQLLEGLTAAADVSLHVPRGVDVPASLEGRADIVTGLMPGIPWEQAELPLRGALGRNDVWLDPANAGPGWGGRRVVVLHDVLPLTHPRAYTPAFRSWFRFVAARAARRADRVVMFSDWARREAVKVLGLDGRRVLVVAQGVGPLDAPAPAEQVARTLARYGLRPGFVLAMGPGDPRKNTAFALEVLVRLRDRGHPVPTLVLAGRPYGHVHATDDAAGTDRGLPVRRLGFVTDDELRALYTAAAVFCFPSLGEGFGRPPLEAMACGTPVVAADYGCAREVLGDAALILPLEPAHWADAVAALLHDQDQRRRRGRAGREHARAFRWDRAVRDVLDACRAVAAGPANGGSGRRTGKEA